ncbi:alpha/beta fold hydrolase [Streptomyces sp. SS7]|uniref:thioesterase II family protein n=1 Tax=Streptomyces sp. SS7 TaxID=3108485 RepID=UPI0030ED060A
MTARTTLVCLPFAGAGASFFRPWQRVAGDGLTILPLQLPGRERRIDEEPHTEARTAVEGLYGDLRAALDADPALPRRIALFGHSLGAVLAYDLAHRLVADPGDTTVVRLFASGCPHPAEQRTRRATGLPDDAFLARVHEFAGYSHEALDDPEMRELILPTLRADVQMHENYAPSTDLPLPVPLTVLRGSHDELVSGEEAAAWEKAAGAGFRSVELSGGHMYLTASAPELLAVVAAHLH